MPQVFGDDQQLLLSMSSLWSESADIQGDPSRLETLHNFFNAEGFKGESDYDHPETPEQKKVSAGRMRWVRDLGNKTIKGQEPRTEEGTGRLLNGDGYHQLVIHYQPKIQEGAPTTAGMTRYELGYQHVDRNGKLHHQSFWSGNSLRGLNTAHARLSDMMGRVK